jgi:hypothetical protein
LGIALSCKPCTSNSLPGARGTDQHRLRRVRGEETITNAWGVVELASGRELMQTTETYSGAVAAIELDPRGGGGILVADWITRDTSHEGRLRRINANGKQATSRDVNRAPRAAWWAEPARAWYVGSCDLELLPVDR